jgi:UDP-galactopyranose mutase
MSAAHNLKGRYLLLEKERTVGGLCRSITVDGHTIDIGGGHVIFTNNEYAKNLFEKLLSKNLLLHERESYIFLQKVYVKYPFEVNLYGLPKKIIDECISGVENKKGSGAKNFHDWIVQTFGKGISKYYMIPYNKKLWNYDLKKMNIEWIADRVPAPNVDDMKRGAEKPISKKFGSNAFFSYPLRGGIQSLADAFSRGLNISFESDVKEIKANKSRVIYERKGETKPLTAEKIFSSLPLPELIKIIDDVPSNIAKAARSLVYNSIICLAIKINRPKVSDKHWIYYPEKGIIFNRIILSSNLSPDMAPKKESSIIIENTYRKDKKIDIEKRKEKMLEDLEKTAIVKKSDKIEVLNCSSHKYAYIVYDLNHKKNVSIIHQFLYENGIIPIGRFGKWEYFNMDKSILDGKNAAENLKL